MRPKNGLRTPRSDNSQPVHAALSAGLQGVLDLHNQYRARHGVAPLTWSASTASSAQSYSANCVFEHSHKPGLGENLGLGYQSWTAVVKACVPLTMDTTPRAGHPPAR